MSAPAGYAPVAPQPVAAPPSMSTALVPVVGDHARPTVPAERPIHAHWMFYGIGYLGLALIWGGIWLSGFVGEQSEALGILGTFFVGLGGFGIFIHTVYKPNERKVRHMLLAISTLVLTGAFETPMQRISREMYATAAVNRVQPMAEALAKDARIREIGVFNGLMILNGYFGPAYGVGSMDGRDGEFTLDEVLARDGISREEYLEYQRRLREVGMERAQRTASTVAFYPDGPRGPWLLYAAPGHPLPRAHELLDDSGRYHSEPLGGPWYMVIHGER